jgi:hypothetical protein
MLGALIGAQFTVQPYDLLDTTFIEDENEDNHWSSDTNLFEDWLLHGADAIENEPDIFY